MCQQWSYVFLALTHPYIPGHGWGICLALCKLAILVSMIYLYLFGEMLKALYIQGQLSGLIRLCGLWHCGWLLYCQYNKFTLDIFEPELLCRQPLIRQCRSFLRIDMKHYISPLTLTAIFLQGLTLCYPVQPEASFVFTEMCIRHHKVILNSKWVKTFRIGFLCMAEQGLSQ